MAAAPPPTRRPTPRPVPPAEVPPLPPLLKWEVVPDAPRSRFLLDKEAEEAARLAENRELRRAFRRAALGCRLIWASFLLYGLSLGLIVAFFILSATRAGERAELLIAAGVFGLSSPWPARQGTATWLTGASAPRRRSP